MKHQHSQKSFKRTLTFKYLLTRGLKWSSNSCKACKNVQEHKLSLLHLGHKVSFNIFHSRHGLSLKVSLSYKRLTVNHTVSQEAGTKSLWLSYLKVPSWTAQPLLLAYSATCPSVFSEAYLHRTLTYHPLLYIICITSNMWNVQYWVSVCINLQPNSWELRSVINMAITHACRQNSQGSITKRIFSTARFWPKARRGEHVAMRSLFFWHWEKNRWCGSAITCLFAAQQHHCLFLFFWPWGGRQRPLAAALAFGFVGCRKEGKRIAEPAFRYGGERAALPYALLSA